MITNDVAHEGKRYREQWGANFRALRERRFDSDEAFAAAMNEAGWPVTRGTVSHWSRGFRLPPLGQIPVIARVLRCRVAKLMPEPAVPDEAAAAGPEAPTDDVESPRLLPSEQRPPTDPAVTMATTP